MRSFVDGRAGNVEGMGEKKKAWRFTVGKPQGKRPLGRPSHGWADDVRMDLREIRCQAPIGISARTGV
jgi:hypothetical protein